MDEQKVTQEEELKVLGPKEIMKKLAVNLMDSASASGVGYACTAATLAMLLPNTKGIIKKGLVMLGASAIGAAACKAVHERNKKDVDFIAEVPTMAKSVVVKVSDVKE